MVIEKDARRYVTQAVTNELALLAIEKGESSENPHE